MIRAHLALLLLCASWSAQAACSGSGLTWACTAGSSKANVNTAISSATSGATITLANGSYTWTSGTLNPSHTKSVTIICESVGGCDMSMGSSALINYSSVTGTTEGTQATWRISGFDFSGCGAPCIWIYPASEGLATQWLTLVFDNNTWTDASNGSDFAYFGEGSRPMVFTGVFAKNTWTNSSQTRIVIYGHADPDEWSGALLGQGNPESGKCLFFEDNVVTFTTPTNGGAGFIDAENASCYVFRFNSSTNARVLQHGVTHGWGTSNFEVYGNTYTRTSNGDSLGNCQRGIHMQGSGTGAFWGNDFTACTSTISGSAIDILHYRDGTPTDAGYSIAGQCDGDDPVDGNTSPLATHRGYPCYHQPGRAPGGNALFPIPIFRNISPTDTKVDASFSCPWNSPEYCSEHVQANRDYYNAVSATAQTSANSPFNGTTGIGHGTLTNRPTTCTHTTAPDGDEGGGVMYWATDQGSWNSSSSNPQGVQQSGADGLLYRCSATNTWTLYYTPYTYPHPLRGETSVLPAPAHFRVLGAAQ